MCLVQSKSSWKSVTLTLVSGKEKLQTNVFGYYVQQPSPWHDSIECNVSQSILAFIPDIA